MPDFKWIDELVESVTGHLRQAEGIALDESVARACRRDVPKLLAAIAALSSLRDAAEDAETEWEYGVPSLVGNDYAYVYASEASARRVSASVVRRRAAGPWLPVPEGNQ